MRIRKHAKISPLVYAASSLKPGTLIQTHVCQLNQSPWDVMTTFPYSSSSSPSSSDPDTEIPPTMPPPPLLCQADKDDDSYIVNGTSTAATDQSAPSMKFEVGKEIQKWDHDVMNNPPPAESFRDGGTEMKQDNVFVGGKIIYNNLLCCKSDGKGWQCRRKAKEGHSLCEHHSSSSSTTHLVNKTGKKSEKSSENRRRTRPKKTSTSSSDPNEYYYYSGFGPRWGKKRGAATLKAAVACTRTGTGTGSETSRNRNSTITGKTTVNRSNSSNNNNNGSENFQFRRRYSGMEIEGLEYIEDEDDDYELDDDDKEYDVGEEEDDGDGEFGQTEKKRVRKPIKARSLKSLM